MVWAAVTVGIGNWKVTRKERLLGIPHVGDYILVNGTSVHCDHVTIGKDIVYVEETIHFRSEQDAKDYFK